MVEALGEGKTRTTAQKSDIHSIESAREDRVCENTNSCSLNRPIENLTVLVRFYFRVPAPALCSSLGGGTSLVVPAPLGL